jgi:hypothetical protein
MIKRVAILLALFAVSLSATAKEPSIGGTWILIGAEKLLPDGTRLADYGPNPHGHAILTADGYYSVQIYARSKVTVRGSAVIASP